MTLKLGNSILNFYSTNPFAAGVERVPGERTEYISLQQHAESQLWVSGGEKICLTGCLCSAFRPPAHFIWKRLLLLCEQTLSEKRIHVSFHMFPQQTSSLYSQSGHSSGPHFHCRTGELKKSQSFCLCYMCVKLSTSFLLVPHVFALQPYPYSVHIRSRLELFCKASWIAFLSKDTIQINGPFLVLIYIAVYFSF